MEYHTEWEKTWTQLISGLTRRLNFEKHSDRIFLCHNNEILFEYFLINKSVWYNRIKMSKIFQPTLLESKAFEAFITLKMKGIFETLFVHKWMYYLEYL